MSDRFLLACRGEPVDATPVWFMRQAGRALPEYRAIREKRGLLEITRLPEVCADVTLQPVRRLGVDAAILFADITLPFEGLGFAFEIREGVGPVVFEPIARAEDVERMRPFDPEEWVAPLLEAIRLVRAMSPVPLIGFAGGPFTLASYLIEGRPTRTFEKIKSFMHARPEAWTALMDGLVDATLAYLRAQTAAGAQALQIFDSWVGALSPRDYRVGVAPHMRRLFASLSGAVPVIHFGTGTAGILGDMAEAGGDVIGVDWRIDIDRARSAVGGRPVQGNLDPAVAAGPWERAAGDARSILAAVNGKPGHVFNLGHGVLPGTPVENLQRLVDLVHGWDPARSAGA